MSYLSVFCFLALPISPVNCVLLLLSHDQSSHVFKPCFCLCSLLKVRSHRWELWEKPFRNVGKFTSWRCYDSTSVRQLGPNLVNRVAQLMTYGDSLFTSDAHDHVGPQRKSFERCESLTQYKRINHHITYFLPCLHFTIDWRCNRLLPSTLLSFKGCVLVNQL